MACFCPEVVISLVQGGFKFTTGDSCVDMYLEKKKIAEKLEWTSRMLISKS